MVMQVRYELNSFNIVTFQMQKCITMVFGGQKSDLVVFLSKSVILRSGGVSVRPSATYSMRGVPLPQPITVTILSVRPPWLRCARRGKERNLYGRRARKKRIWI